METTMTRDLPTTPIDRLEAKIEDIEENRKLATHADLRFADTRQPDAIDEYVHLRKDPLVGLGIRYLALDTIAKKYKLYESEGDAATVTDYISEELGSSDYHKVFDSLKRLKQNYSLVYHNDPPEFERIEKIIREQLAKTGIELPPIEPTILTPRKVPTPLIKEQSPPRFDPQPVISIERETIATPEKEPIANIPIQPSIQPPIAPLVPKINPDSSSSNSNDRQKTTTTPPVIPAPSNNTGKWAIAIFAIGFMGWMFGGLTNKNPSINTPPLSSNDSSSSSQSISQEDALDLIKRWQDAKKQVFSRQYDRTLGMKFLMGKAYRDSIEGSDSDGKPSSLEKIQQSNQYYTYSNQSIGEVTRFQKISENQILIEVKVSEDINLMEESSIQRQTFSRGFRRYYIQRTGDNLKIYDYCKMDNGVCRKV
jgi:hypothetical protein